MSGSSGYRSALSFNVREFVVVVIGGLIFLVLLAVPLLVAFAGGWTGTALDPYKDISAVTTPDELLPAQQPLAADYAENYAAGVYDVGAAGRATMSAQLFESPAAALDWWNALPSGVVNQAPGKYLRRWQEEGNFYLAWVNGRFGLMMSAASEAALDGLVRLSEWIDAPDEPGYGKGPRPFLALLTDRYPWAFVLLFDALIILFMWAIFGGGIALATRRPHRGTARVTRDELRTRLLALNSGASPFVVEDLGRFHLRGRYRFDDADLSTLFAKEGFSEAYQIDMYLTRHGTVLALESRGSVNWEVSAVPPEASYSWSAFRGIVFFDYKWEKEWAFDPQTMRFTAAGEFRFNADDFKRPLVATVVQSGWTWRPALFRPLVWSA